MVNVKGVPQGSVLGPFFISIVINNLGQDVKVAYINLYADDTYLLCWCSKLGNALEFFS